MKVNAILATVLSIATVAFAAPAESAALEERQLLGALNNVLCPISGTPLCSAQCLLIRQIEGQCSPSGTCFCNDGTEISLLMTPSSDA